MTLVGTLLLLKDDSIHIHTPTSFTKHASRVVGESELMLECGSGKRYYVMVLSKRSVVEKLPPNRRACHKIDWMVGSEVVGSIHTVPPRPVGRYMSTSYPHLVTLVILR